MGGGAIYEKITTVIPNAEIELYELQQMSCPQIKERNEMGSYWLPSNGLFARGMIDSCLAIEADHKKTLKGILKIGTHQEKIDAGFTKLWFGVYDHSDLPFKTKQSIVKIIHTNEHGISEFSPGYITVIIGYNNTIKFENESDDVYIIQENYNAFTTEQIKIGSTASITLNKVGEYEYFAKPWMIGTINVLEQ